MAASTTLPVRGLGSAGIIKDMEPWDAPWEAWSGGTNVRFEDGKAMRAPIYRTFGLLSPSPTGSQLVDVSGMAVLHQQTGTDQIFAADSFGRVSQILPPSSSLSTGSLTDVSGASTVFTPIAASTQFTTCYLGGITYLNRETHTPRYFGTASTAFAPIPNQDSPFTCNILRAIESYLVAFNVNIGGVQYPRMVKWSDATPDGAPPPDWSTASISSLAGANTLTQMDSGIVDANNLAGNMIIYGNRQIWTMQPTGDQTFVWTFTKLWEDDRWGAINRNCSIEVDGLHYVFGNADLYVHDGVSRPQSIADGKVRKWVFSTMNTAKLQNCFVMHDPFLNTVYFCYVSGDSDVVFTNPTGCNKAAAFNYKSSTWGFVELPNISSAVIANATTVQNWATDTKTWATAGGSWLSQQGPNESALIVGGPSLGTLLPTGGVYAMDPLLQYSRVNLPQDPHANSAPYLEHGGISLDQAQLPLQNFKWVQSIIPAGRIQAGGPMTIYVGAAEVTNVLPNYPATGVSFDPTVDYYIPARASGRYAAVKIMAPTFTDFDLTGFDLNIVGGGRR